jgi:hypothetical protein
MRRNTDTAARAPGAHQRRSWGPSLCASFAAKPTRCRARAATTPVTPLMRGLVYLAQTASPRREGQNSDSAHPLFQPRATLRSRDRVNTL